MRRATIFLRNQIPSAIKNHRARSATWALGLAAFLGAAVVSLIAQSVPPAILTPPQSQTVNPGTTVTFSVDATGTAPLSYQWQFNGANLPGANASSLTLNNVDATVAGSYQVVVSNAAGSVTSAVATLVVNTPPSVTTQPLSQTVSPGANVTFVVQAVGSPPLQYQWQFNGSDMVGAIGRALTLTNVQPADAGGYRAIVSNIAGSVASFSAILTVALPTGSPSLVAQPASQEVFPGANAGFCATIAGSAPLSYQWFLNGMPLSDGGNLSGTTGGCLTVLGAQLTNAGTYTLVASNAYGAVTSDGAVLLLTQSGAEVDFSNAGPGVNAPVFDVDGVTRLSGAAYLAQLYAGPTATNLAAVGAAVPFFTGNEAGYWSVVPDSVRGIPTVIPGSVAFVQARVWQSGKGLTFEQAAAAGSKLGESAILSITVGSAGPPPALPVSLIGLQSFALQSPPTISTQPVSQSVSAGSTVTFSVTAAGPGPSSFQWQFNGTPIAGATNSSLTLGNVQPSQAGNYTVMVGNLVGSVTSAIATLTILTPPTITSGPVSQSVVAGANVSFTVTASGPGTLGYQWNFNGTPVMGATYATLTLANAQPSQAGNYTVTVSNAAGSVTSAAATLTVLAPPSVISGPASQTVMAGANVTFSVTVAGAGTLSYQWNFNGAPLAGATGASLTLTNVQSAQAGNYAVTVSNAAGATPSAVATLTVLALPNIVAGPVSQTAAIGTNVTFSVNATGAGPLRYQWQFNGAPILGATSATLTLTNVQLNQAGGYNVAVSNPAGTVASTAAILTVAMPPSIVAGPVSQTVAVGARVTFSVATGGSGPLIDQWIFNGSPIAGATNATLTLTNVQVAATGNYSVTVTNAVGSITSAPATLTVLVPPTIATEPASQTVTTGTNVTFSVTASGSGPLIDQWIFNGSPIAGATNATLTLTNVQVAATGNYSVTVTNAVGSITSAPATLTVLVPPTIATEPASQTVIAGTEVTFSVTASGSGPLANQWNFNGSPIAGATNVTLILTNVQAAQAGNYSVTVTNAVGSITSAPATLTVLVPPTIATEPASQTVMAGTEVTFSVTATGTSPLSYQWQFNGTALGGATNTTLTLTNVQAAQAGGYSVVVTNVAGQAVSSIADLRLTGPLRFASNPVVTNGVFQVMVTGNSGATIRIDVSTNLMNWGSLTTLINFNGQALVSDPQAKLYPRRFYRAVVATTVLVPPGFGGNAALSNATFQAVLMGSGGTGMRIDYSTNLVDWLSLATLTNFNGQAMVTDPQAAGSPQRFYRAVVTP